MSRPQQGRIWMLTIPKNDWSPPTELNNGLVYILGQAELGVGGYEHWQLLCWFNTNKRLSAVKNAFCPTAHCELSKSAAAEAYVQKDDTYIDGTRFCVGEKPFKRNSKTDWDKQLSLARRGEWQNCDPDIQLRFYGTLKAIAKDNRQIPEDLSGTCGVWIWGPPGVGKSRWVREQYGQSLFSKMINKWWDGYADEKFVLLDDFDKMHLKLGHHLKIWADRYKFIGEMKGTSLHLRPDKILITSNYQISDIFEDPSLIEAITRRFQIIHMPHTPFSLMT